MTIPELITELEKIHSKNLDENKGNIRIMSFNGMCPYNLKKIKYYPEKHAVILTFD